MCLHKAQFRLYPFLTNSDDLQQPPFSDSQLYVQLDSHKVLISIILPYKK